MFLLKWVDYNLSVGGRGYVDRLEEESECDNYNKANKRSRHTVLAYTARTVSGGVLMGI